MGKVGKAADDLDISAFADAVEQLSQLLARPCTDAIKAGLDLNLCLNA